MPTKDKILIPQEWCSQLIKDREYADFWEPILKELNGLSDAAFTAVDAAMVHRTGCLASCVLESQEHPRVWAVKAFQLIREWDFVWINFNDAVERLENAEHIVPELISTEKKARVKSRLQDLNSFSLSLKELRALRTEVDLLREESCRKESFAPIFKCKKALIFIGEHHWYLSELRAWEKAETEKAQAEEAARLQAKAEEAARLRAKAEEAARLQAKAEEAARLRAKAEEAARLRAKAEEAARLQAKAEEAARLQAKATAKALAEKNSNRIKKCIGAFLLMLAVFVAVNDHRSSTKAVAEAKAQAEAEKENRRRRAAGEAWVVVGVGVKMVPIAAGSFAMGSTNGRDNEKPVTQVTLTKPYWLGATEVTQGQWEAVMGSNPSNFKGSNLPVETVSYEDAMGFCRKLTERERAGDRLPAGYEYTLPTEAQWEYACRAGTTGDYAGNLDAMGWYGGNSGRETHEVGGKQANAWGLYDMHGNVWEWCADWYAEKLPGGSVRDSKGPAWGSDRVVRGGSWGLDAAYCRSADRYGNSPGYRYGILGFRLALSSEQNAAAPKKILATKPALGEAWVVENVGVKMVPIAAGSFAMGSANGGFGEKPVTRVTLTRPYWLGATEVTQGQWEAVMGNNPSALKGSNLPVEQVSYEDAMEFCQKLTERERAADRLPEGYAYTLPTEAQWEYACRAGTTGDYAGNLDAMGWYDDNSGKKTHEVGGKQANAWGLYDMHGNVWEWCLDWYPHKLPGGSVTDPRGDSSGSARVLRGGSWLGSAEDCGSAVRYGGRPGYREDFLGFRLALSSEQDAAAPKKILARKPALGSAWVVESVGVKMVPIAAGRFAMGSSDGGSDEKPVTQVTLTKPYWLGATEVTQGQWEAIMGNNPSNLKGGNLPVEQVSYEDAMEFCQKLTERERAADRLPEGYAYTLPTEAQWEYACRAGTTGDYAGNLDAMGWYNGNSGKKTHEVGGKQANAWGLYDMHGNVWEWCLDWYTDKLPGGSVSDSEGPASGSFRVSRGGSWVDVAAFCRSARRFRFSPGRRNVVLGFRLALSSEQDAAAPKKILATKPALGEVWAVEGGGVKMVPIAAGSFAMGSTNGDGDEKPVTQVTLTKPYWLGATEVTQGQWEAVMGSNPSNFKGSNLPVETVSYEDAMAFCRKLTERERAAGRLPAGYEYTLPTEAQWEYACRAGTTGDYAGNLDAMGWYRDNSGSTTHAVGGKQANAWGLYDMHGNVWEWCLDWQKKYAGGNVTDPRGASSGSLRVYRGGSWYGDAGNCRSAFRLGNAPGYRFSILGFRLALSSETIR